MKAVRPDKPGRCPVMSDENDDVPFHASGRLTNNRYIYRGIIKQHTRMNFQGFTHLVFDGILVVIDFYL